MGLKGKHSEGLFWTRGEITGEWVERVGGRGVFDSARGLGRMKSGREGKGGEFGTDGVSELRSI